jgi:hypothetical protein
MHMTNISFLNVNVYKHYIGCGLFFNDMLYYIDLTYENGMYVIILWLLING